MKRPLVYITAAWTGDQSVNTEQTARYCRAAYKAGFSPVCPLLYLYLFLNNDIPEEYKSGIDISRDMLRRAHVLMVYEDGMAEDVKNDIAVAGRFNITATTLDSILTVEDRDRGARRD